MTRPYRVFCAVMVGVFVLSAVVQWNDPDPGRWIAFYALAAITALAALLRARVVRGLEIALAVVALGTVLVFAPALGDARVEAVTSFKMKSSDDEEFRELGGAAIVLAYAGVMLVHRARKTPSA